MVTIKKGNHKLTVSKETYLNMFKELGYELVDNSIKKENNINKSNIKNNKKETKKLQKEEKSKMDNFLEDVCENGINTSKEKEEESTEEVSDILSIMSKEKEKKDKEEL